MATPFPSDIGNFIQTELATGHYRDEAELVLDALRTFRELKLRYQGLLEEVQESIAQAERGEVHELDTDATKAEARRRFAAKPEPA